MKVENFKDSLSIDLEIKGIKIHYPQEFITDRINTYKNLGFGEAKIKEIIWYDHIGEEIGIDYDSRHFTKEDWDIFFKIVEKVVGNVYHFLE